MSPLRLFAFAVPFIVCLAGCGSGTDTGTAITASAVIRQVTPTRARFDDVVAAYGQGAMGSDGTRVLTLPLDATLTGVDVVVGERVHAGQRLARFAPSKAASAARVAARSAVDVALEQRDRIARLLADHLATNEQLAQAVKALHDGEAALAAQSTPDDILRAPVDGTVVSVDAQRGALMAAGSPLLTLADSADLDFLGGIEPADAARVHVDDPVTLTPLGGGQTVHARVTAVAGAVNPSSRLVNVRAKTASPLILGAGYRADIVVGSIEGWRVSADAVVGDDDRRLVWQVINGKAHGVEVTLVAQRHDEALIEGNIDPSKPLVTAGAPQLDEGMQVRPVAWK